ncbi:helix-turn-helix domain-containing protein [Rufibacter soli]
MRRWNKAHYYNLSKRQFKCSRSSFKPVLEDNSDVLSEECGHVINANSLEGALQSAIKTIGDLLRPLLVQAVKEAIHTNILTKVFMQPDNTVLTVKEAAKLLNVSEVTIHNWKSKGLIPFYRISRRIFFKKNEVLKFNSLGK